MIFAVGGVSALLGSLIAEPGATRLGARRAMVAGLTLSGAASLLAPLAHGAGVLSVVLLIAQQLVGDGAAVLFTVNALSLRQRLTPDASRGRVNASVRFLGLAAMLLGSLAAGALAERFGLRAVLVLATLIRISAALWLAGATIQVPDGGDRTADRLG